MQDRDLHVLSPGTKLNNRYVIDGIIGEGGFGITYKGRDELLRVTVAVKEFYPHGVVVRNNTVNDNLTVTNMAQNEMFERGKEKFLQEAQIIAQFVDQDGIVNVTDFFEENNTAYIVMEYLSGVTLKEYINQNGAISPVDMLNLTVPVIEALDRIHREGLIHRDISPDNIMLLENGKVKLMDFGAARDYTEFGEKSLSIVLKPGYAPEEQYRSRGVQGPWTDIYALSATIYKCITGITPDESMQRVMEDDIKSPSELHIDIPAGMERAIMKGMSVRAADRYQNLSDFSADLYGDFEEETGTPSTRQPRDDSPAGGRWSTSGGKTVSRSSGSSSSSRGTAAGEPKKKNNVLIIGGAAAAFVVVIIAFLIGRSGSGGQKAALSNSAPSVVTESPDSAGSDSDQVSSDADSSQEAVTEAVTEAEESTEAALTEVSDDLMDYTFQLKDKVYQLPFKYERLKEDGWMMTTSNGDMTEETLLASDEQELIFLTDGTEYAHVGFNVYNPSDNAVKIGESYVCGIIVNARTDFGFVTSKGINLSSGADEVKSAFGTPYKIDQYDNYDVLLYSAGELSEGSAYFYCYDNNESNSISMKHKPKDFRVEVEVSEDKPDYLSSYKAPDKLPDKATETIFQLDGKLYQLPCPLGEFTDAGWEVAGRNVNSVGGYKSETSCIKIAKDGYSIDLDMTNFDPTARTTENCAVSGIRVTNRHKDTDMQGDYMKFSGGINVSMEADEAEDKLEGFDKSDSSSYVSFRYSSDDYSKTIHYMWSVYGNFDLSNKKWNY